MQAYPSTAALNKPDVAPAVPVLIRTYQERAQLFGEHNPSFKHGRGTKRRHRREVDTRQGLDARAAILRGAQTFPGADGVARTWRELIHANLDGRPPFLVGLRARARRLMDQISEHGPASGWGIAQPVAGAERNPKWTPYEVPKRSEKCWRWWRARRIELARLLRALAWLWGRAVPAHRTAHEGTPPVRQEKLPSSCLNVERTRYRDRSAEPWAAAAARLRSRLGM